MKLYRDRVDTFFFFSLFILNSHTHNRDIASINIQSIYIRRSNNNSSDEKRIIIECFAVRHYIFDWCVWRFVDCSIHYEYALHIRVCVRSSFHIIQIDLFGRRLNCHASQHSSLQTDEPRTSFVVISFNLPHRLHYNCVAWRTQCVYVFLWFCFDNIIDMEAIALGFF